METTATFHPPAYVTDMSMDALLTTHQEEPIRPQPMTAMVFDAPFPQFSTFGGPSHAQLTTHPQASKMHPMHMQQAMFQMSMQYPSSVSSSMTSTSGKKTQSKAERRAEHNAIERARRECLNTKFQQLAHALPNLQNDRRPSKGTIIDRTLDYLRHSMNKEQRYKNQMRHLRMENRQLRKQLMHRGMQSSVLSVSDEDPSYLSSSSFDLSATPTPTLPNKELYPHPSQQLTVANPAQPVSQPQQHRKHNPTEQWDMYPTDMMMPTMFTSTSPFDELSDDDNSTNNEDFEASSFVTGSDQFSASVMLQPEYNQAMAKEQMASSSVPGSEYAFATQHTRQ